MNPIITELEEQLRAAMLNSDVDSLDQLLADDLIFTTANGQVISKKDDLEIHKSGLLNFQRLDLSEFRVAEHNSVAVVSVTAQIQATMGNQPADGTMKFTRIWQKQSAGWKVIGGHCSVKL